MTTSDIAQNPARNLAENQDQDRIARAPLPFLESRAARLLLPVLLAVAVVAGWEWLVVANDIKPYVLPAPSRVWATLLQDWPTLGASFLVTLQTALTGMALAFVGGVALGVIMGMSRLLESAFFPYAVILQVTPIIAVAPILLIYFSAPTVVLTTAFIVTYFPVLSNTITGMRSTDRGLEALFDLYGASGWQKILQLKLKSALPFILTGFRIGGPLALIGAVVAEIVAGTAGAGSGLAYRIIESTYRLNVPRAFAALFLLSLMGIAIFYVISIASHLLLRKWHESALEREH
jgi:NitT/TauT family transport system permease protein